MSGLPLLGWILTGGAFLYSVYKSSRIIADDAAEGATVKPSDNPNFNNTQNTQNKNIYVSKNKKINQGDSSVKQPRINQSLSASIESSEMPPLGSKLCYPVIGVITSGYSTRNGTPRQPLLVSQSRAQLKLCKNIPFQSLSGLQAYSHCWIIFDFHQNTNKHKGNVKGTVAPPRLGKNIGVFATRSPHRPAPIGLSLAQILWVDEAAGVVWFQGLDIVNGTPVLDIKPYGICDAPSVSSLATSVLAPSWVCRDSDKGDVPLAILSVDIPPQVSAVLANVWYQLARKGMKKKHILAVENESEYMKEMGVITSPACLYSRASEFELFVKQVLSLDIRSQRERERSDDYDGDYRVTLCNIVIYYRMSSVSTEDNRKSLTVTVTNAHPVTLDTSQPLNVIPYA